MKEQSDTPPTKVTALARLAKRLRTQAGLSLNEAGKRAGLNRTTLLRIERGERQPSQRVLNTLARVYGVEPEVLYDAAWAGREGLPSLSTYFRKKYRLSDEQIAAMEQTLRRIKGGPTKKQSPKERGSR